MIEWRLTAKETATRKAEVLEKRRFSTSRGMTHEDRGRPNAQGGLLGHGA